MTYYIKRGDTYSTNSESALDIHKLLPVGNYTIAQDTFGEFYFQAVDSFTLPKKLYGDTTKQCTRIFNTFNDRPNSTGVLLAGEKGSGKSLLAKCLSNRAAEDNIPTIIINAPWHGDKFNTLIQQIQQPCVIIFDEFEKTYKAPEQEKVLTLLDGTFPTNKLFILTCNNKWGVDKNMRNRPGRIFYLIDFCGLSPEFIVDYCEDNLNNKEHIDTLCKVSTLFDEFNFDMLSAIVEDMNRYGETPQEALELLNAKPEYNQDMEFDVTLMIDDVWLTLADLYNKAPWQGNPLTGTKNIEYRVSDGNGDYDWDNYARFETGDLANVDARDGTFTFKNKNNNVLILTRRLITKINYFKAF